MKKALKHHSISDVFFMSHGWEGGVAAAATAAPAQTRAMPDETPSVEFGAGGAACPRAGGCGDLAVTSSIAADVADPASGQVAVRTRIGRGGDVETVISTDQAGNQEVLELRRRMVNAVLHAWVSSPRPEGEAGEPWATSPEGGNPGWRVNTS